MTAVRRWSWVALAGLAVPLALVSVPAQAATAAKPYDFDGDGYPELVVGAPDLDVGSHDEAGGVAWEMSRSSTVTSDRTVLTQSSSRVPGASEDGDHFGAAVASADFDRDGFADLAVGQPGEDGAKTKDAGAITILYGSPEGPTGKGSARFAQPKEERDARFGAALAAGDLDGDGFADLVVGAPGDDNEDAATQEFPATGTVTVLLGGKDGIQTQGRRVLRGVRGTDPEDHDHAFGSSLGVADVDADGRADVVVAAAGAITDENGYPASVSFCAGTATGPSGCRRLGRNGLGVGEYRAVVVGDVAGNAGAARPEIVVGVSGGEDDLNHLDVYALTGTGTATRAKVGSFDESDAGLPGASVPDEYVDGFGSALAVHELTGDAYADLVVGAPHEAVGDERAGRVILVRGGADGLARTGNRAFDQETPGVPGGSETGDDFGAALTFVDRDLDGRDDLVVGVPGKGDDGGRVVVLRGTGSGLTGTGSEAYQLSHYGYDARGQARFGGALAQG